MSHPLKGQVPQATSQTPLKLLSAHVEGFREVCERHRLAPFRGIFGLKRTPQPQRRRSTEFTRRMHLTSLNCIASNGFGLGLKPRNRLRHRQPTCPICGVVRHRKTKLDLRTSAPASSLSACPAAQKPLISAESEPQRLLPTPRHLDVSWYRGTLQTNDATELHLRRATTLNMPTCPPPDQRFAQHHVLPAGPLFELQMNRISRDACRSNPQACYLRIHTRLGALCCHPDRLKTRPWASDPPNASDSRLKHTIYIYLHII